MKKLTLLSGMILFTGLSMISCSHKSQPSTTAKTDKKELNPGSTMALPPCIIYKTKADYHANVPVSLSDDKTRITSYPAVSDIRNQAGSVYPQELSNGFLLDNRGIGPDVAFLTITYDDYLKLTETPAADILFQQVLDADPIMEMYQCGSRYHYEDIVGELNQMIDSGKLSDCKKIK